MYDFLNAPDWTFGSNKELAAKEKLAAAFSTYEDLYNIMP